MSTTYIAVTELHARPDLNKPQVITPAGKPFEAPDGYDVADLVSSGALRKPTAEEVKLFNIDDKAKAKPAAAATTKPAAAATAATGKKAAAGTVAGGDGNDTVAGGDGNDTVAGGDDAAANLV